MTKNADNAYGPVPVTEPLALGSSEGLGALPPQRESQYLTMTICGTNDDPAECGHWASPAHVQWLIDKAVAAERERCKDLVRRYMPAGWSAVYDAMADEGPNAEVQPGATVLRCDSP